MSRRHVILGGGPAGVVAAETLRGLDPEAEITLICGEPGEPYARMAIPYLLAGHIDEAGTRLRKRAGHYAGHAIELRHDRAESIDATAGRVHLASGASLAYDRLLVATGARPMVPEVPGIDRPGVHGCWTLEDARRVAARAVEGASVVLIGAGFIGSILLEALVRRGTLLTVIEAGERMVPRMMDARAGGLIRTWCAQRGVDVRVSSRVVELRPGSGGGLRVVLDDGTELPADLVITAVGVRPNTDLLAGSGADIDGGVRVDGHLRTDLLGVYAAGDVARGPDFSTGETAVHAIQTTAVEQGRVAALNMAGRSVPYRGSLAMNVLDTLGLVSASFGRWMGAEGGESAELHDPEGFRYLNLRFEGERLIGATSVGHTERIGVLRGLIQGRVPLGCWKTRLLHNPSRITEAYLRCAYEH